MSKKNKKKKEMHPEIVDIQKPDLEIRDFDQ